MGMRKVIAAVTVRARRGPAVRRSETPDARGSRDGHGYETFIAAVAGL